MASRAYEQGERLGKEKGLAPELFEKRLSCIKPERREDYKRGYEDGIRKRESRCFYPSDLNLRNLLVVLTYGESSEPVPA